MSRLTLGAAVVALALFSLLLPVSARAARGEPAPIGGATAAGVVQINRPLDGVVLAWQQGRLVRQAGAHIGTGERAFRTDANGRFRIPAAARTNQINVVRAGYEVVRRTTTADYVAVLLRPLTVRAMYVRFFRLAEQPSLDWILDLARTGTITAVVLDMKDDSGFVPSLFATEAAYEVDAVRDLGTDLEAFLDDLDRLGIYKIARLVTFRDNRFARAFPAEGILTSAGTLMVDAQGVVWTNVFSERVQGYNIEIAAKVAGRFEEVQFDYVRFPGEADVAVRATTTSEQRSAAVAQFLAKAAAVIHARGAAISADTFGQTTMITDDGGIGQVLELLAPHLDYYSPMVYPSTWTPGWFGLAYPPADPYTVVFTSVATAVTRLQPYPGIAVRPWLQDFHDYQAQKLFYGLEEVRAQIKATAEAGGSGFMLWDPGLNYQLGALGELTD